MRGPGGSRCCTGAAALAATAPGTSAREDAAGRWQRAFTDIDAHRILQTSDAGKGLLHPAAAKVIATLNNEWDGLAHHQDLPQLPLDNNTAERALRTPVISHNFYGSGAAWAAHLAADVWTITATAARHDIEPLGLLESYLQECARNGGTAPGRSQPGPLPALDTQGRARRRPAVTSARAPAADLPISGVRKALPRLSCHTTPRPTSLCPAGTATRSPRVPRLLTSAICPGLGCWRR